MRCVRRVIRAASKSAKAHSEQTLAMGRSFVGTVNPRAIVRPIADALLPFRGRASMETDGEVHETERTFIRKLAHLLGVRISLVDEFKQDL